MKKILCFRNSKLGDYLISLPALQLIKKKYPSYKIFYLSSRNENAPLLPKQIEKKKFVDEFIYFNNNFYDLFKLFKYLRKQKFQKLYYIQEKSTLAREIRDYFFFRLSGIVKLYGFFNKKKNYSKFSETLQITKRIDQNINQLKLNQLTTIKSKGDKPIFNYKYITISIGGFSQPILWKIQNWGILTNLICKNLKYKIIILGTNKDLNYCNFLLKQNKICYYPLCGKTNINQLFNIIKYSKFHITNDNGSMHVASLYSKKTLCLFNNHDPLGKWYPANKNAIIIRPKNGVNTISPYKVFIKLKRFF